MRQLHLAALVCTILFAFKMVALADPQEGFKSGYKNGGLCFYEDENFRGRKFCARTGEKLKSLAGKWDNNFSSVQLDEKLVVYVCKSRDFKGSCRFFRRGSPNLDGEWNNSISSIHIVLRSSEDRVARLYQNQRAETEISGSDNSEQQVASNRPDENRDSRVEVAPEREREDETPSQREDADDRETANNDVASNNADDAEIDRDESRTDEVAEVEKPEVCFYDNTGYRGENFCLDSNKALHRLPDRWNDDISSIKITGSAEIKLCEDTYLEGKCLILKKSSDYIGRGWSNRASSLRIRFLHSSHPGSRDQYASNRDSENSAADDDDEDADDEVANEVCFHQNRKFRGRSVCIPVGKTLNRLSRRLDDTISSIEVHGDARVVIKVCEHAYLEGECRTYYRSKRFVGWSWNDRISSIRVRLDRRGTY
ncbi:MAG: peptidase inhibitor family I36 protein [Methyloligellaceae bacterium]